MAATTTHGRLHDEFGTYTPDTHGGSLYDEGFPATGPSTKHGRLHDDFADEPGRVSSHGERWDEFGWQAMPAIHGQLFDTGFQQATANDGEHGTWFDVFRGGTQVRYMHDGADYEGTVMHVNDEYAEVRSRDGQIHEVGLSQFLGYRSPSDAQVDPGVPASDAEAPSARSSARGGGRTEADAESAMASQFANKTAVDATETALMSTTSNGTPKPGAKQGIASDGSEIPAHETDCPANGGGRCACPIETGPQTEDEQTDQGQPSRKQKRAHKSLADALDVLKSVPNLEPRR